MQGKHTCKTGKETVNVSSKKQMKRTAAKKKRKRVSSQGNSKVFNVVGRRHRDNQS